MAGLKARKRRTVTASGQGKGAPGHQNGYHLRAEQYGKMAGGGSRLVAPTKKGNKGTTTTRNGCCSDARSAANGRPASSRWLTWNAARS